MGVGSAQIELFEAITMKNSGLSVLFQRVLDCLSCTLKSVGNVNLALFASLMFMGLCPAVYTTLRTNFLGQLPGDWSYSIAGQLSWVNLMYEVVDEAIILPLFFLLGNPSRDETGFSNRLKSGLLVAMAIYSAFSLAVCVFTVPLLNMMAVDHSIIAKSAQYIRIEAVANVFGLAYRFLCVAIIATGETAIVYLLTLAKLGLSVLLDVWLVSSLPCSLNLGVNGIGVSNIVTNLALTVFAIRKLRRLGLLTGWHDRVEFAWLWPVAHIGLVSGAESLVRNLAYMLMVSRMVNVVGEQGTYWVANNFIWGWLLLPVLQLGELIKKETAESEDAIERNTPGYFAITATVIALWLVCIPGYKAFMSHVLGFSDVDKLYQLVMVLLPFYILFAVQNVFDATFYGRGRTDYMLFESVVTNSIFYGGMYVAYATGLWTPTLLGIALMFGVGNAFDSVVSWLAYRKFRMMWARG